MCGAGEHWSNIMHQTLHNFDSHHERMDGYPIFIVQATGYDGAWCV